MFKKIAVYISQITNAFESIPAERKKNLQDVAIFITQELNEKGVAKLNFICTHNSRRSQLAQIWAQTAAIHYGIEGVKTCSGGTEATAFNPKAVAAIRRAGFKVNSPGGDNPQYKVYFSDDNAPMICFSKTFDDSANPQENFAAIMTCSDADANCPFVPGASFRKSVTYRDPKESDGTDHEMKTYDERCRQIASEMFYMMSRV